MLPITAGDVGGQMIGRSARRLPGSGLLLPTIGEIHLHVPGQPERSYITPGLVLSGECKGSFALRLIRSTRGCRRQPGRYSLGCTHRVLATFAQFRFNSVRVNRMRFQKASQLRIAPMRRARASTSFTAASIEASLPTSSSTTSIPCLRRAWAWSRFCACGLRMEANTVWPARAKVSAIGS